MNHDQLINDGTRLEADLIAASDRHAQRSDMREILGYESGTIAAYVRFLRDGMPVEDRLKESCLLGEWGKHYSWEEPELRQRAAAFYAALQEFLS